jgi:diguanylate cyclase (GGDEF)-like protein
VTTTTHRSNGWRASLIVFASGPAAALALPWLQRAGLIAATPLWILLCLLVACSAANGVAQSIAHRLPAPSGLQLRSAVAAFSTAWFVYACGWGSLTVIAYAIAIADTMRIYGSRAWRPGLLWSAAAIGTGELAVGFGIAPSMLPPGVAHAAAITTFVCLAILARTLGLSFEATELATAEVEEGRTYFRDLVQHAADVIALVNPELCVEYASPGITNLAGHDPAWCVGRSIGEILGAQAGADISRAYDNLTLADYLSCEWLLTNEVGENRRVLARLTRRTDGSLVLNLRDITEQRALEAQLERRAMFDDLTGLPNRAALIEQLRGMSTLADLTVLFIDLDGFKEVNDSLGHEQGDAVLRCVANTIAATVPPGVDIGRLGGDEFLAITSMTDMAAIEEIGGQIIASIEGLGAMTGNMISASIGIACGATGELPEQLLRRADQAMYAAKKRRAGLIVAGAESTSPTN